ncbi:hypothetical protein [Aquimarina algiphila]|uniref:ParB/Sulfiredoxin domain-containing protein n=1 Tax=Aquimarina algiphila TaxID=2047982 RepID=A0A554VRI3_9FLAO|nr:hypothetical protein [Aquimarina algiphila]TSE11255.1 hypothetical protein FOF46_01105 [Aquimarina algiphila]
MKNQDVKLENQEVDYKPVPLTDQQQKVYDEILSYADVENRFKSPLKLVVLLVTPEMAKKFLKRNRVNRSLSKQNIQKAVLAMKTGEWDENTGDVIKFNINGDLIDGQHRLHAVIELGIAVPMTFMFNCSKDALFKIDTGKKRSISDILSMNNIKYYTEIPAIILFEQVIRFTKGSSKGAQSYRSPDPRLSRSNVHVLEETLKRKEWYYLLMVKGNRYREAMRDCLPKSFLAKFYNIFVQIDKDHADRFFDALCYQKNVYGGHPCLTLRELYIENYKSTFKKLATREKEACMILAWNAFINGEDIWNFDKLNLDKFPTVFGIKNFKRYEGIPESMKEEYNAIKHEMGKKKDRDKKKVA